MAIGRKFHHDQIEVTDFCFATFLKYLGYDIMKVTSPGRDQLVWTFLVPEHDFEMVKQEFENGETTMLVKPFCLALKTVQHFMKIAYGQGEHVTPAWRRIVTESRT